MVSGGLGQKRVFGFAEAGQLRHWIHPPYLTGLYCAAKKYNNVGWPTNYCLAGEYHAEDISLAN
jgi:hypothetical protein